MTGTRMFVYGIFTETNECLYVGHTLRPKSRAHQHRARFGNAEFRILKECGTDGLKHERDIIGSYWLKGQAQHNKNTLPSKDWTPPTGIQLHPANQSLNDPEDFL